MSSDTHQPHARSIRAMLRRIAWGRIVYPFGVVLVFSVIGVSTVLSYRFFTLMITRATVLPFVQETTGATFSLRAYKNIAPFFGLLPKSNEHVTADRTLRIGLTTSESSSDRTTLLYELFKKDGFDAVLLAASGTEPVQSTTTIRAKADRIKEALLFTQVLRDRGFVVTPGAALEPKEKHDILIRVGTY